MDAYATPQQLANYLHVEVANLDADHPKALRSAQGLVQYLIRFSLYPTDDEGNATEAAHIQAITDATCAQAAWMLETGDVSGISAAYASMALGSLSLQGNRGKQGESQDTQSARIAPDAVIALANVGLLKPTVGAAW